jgi:hypothetical protein
VIDRHQAVNSFDQHSHDPVVHLKQSTDDNHFLLLNHGPAHACFLMINFPMRFLQLGHYEHILRECHPSRNLLQDQSFQITIIMVHEATEKFHIIEIWIFGPG